MTKYLSFCVLNFLFLSSCISITKEGISFSVFENEGKEPIIARNYSDLKFCGIEINNGIKAKLMKSDVEKVIVNAPADIIDNILIDQLEGNNIHIHVKTNSNISTKKVKVEIYTRELCKIASSSGSSIEVIDKFTSPSLHLSANSGSNLKGGFTTKTATLNTSSGASLTANLESIESIISASSGSSINLTGFSKNAKANASSGSIIEAEKYCVSEANVESTSGGEIQICSTKNAVANSSSGSHITIYKKGSQFNLTKQVSSGGNVQIK